MMFIWRSRLTAEAFHDAGKYHLNCFIEIVPALLWTLVDLIHRVVSSQICLNSNYAIVFGMRLLAD